MQVGVNHLGHFALTIMLLKRMTETKEFGSIINFQCFAMLYYQLSCYYVRKSKV